MDAAGFPFDLSDRVALVTGGGTGIGAAIARVLASHGADVVVASRKMDNLTKVADEVTASTGRKVLPIAADVRSVESVDAMVDRTVQEFGGIDILVNNAGGAYMYPLLQTPPERWDNMVALNLRGPCVAAEFGPKGIRCNAIAVGGVASEGALRSWERFGQTAETMGQGVPLRRVGQPEDIAWGVYYLASDMSSWVSGQTLGIDGGPVMAGLPDEALT